MEPVFAATVDDVHRAGGRLRLLNLHVPRAVRQSFTKAGQYLQVQFDDQRALWALATAPHEDDVQVLLRDTPAALTWLQANPTPELKVSALQGPGFPLHLIGDRPLLLVATGSGLGPIRSVIRHLLHDRPEVLQRTTLVYGVMTPDDLVLQSEFEDWQRKGLKLHTLVSEENVPWSGERGWVQQALQRMPVSQHVAFLCGQSEMIADVRVVLTRAGVAETDIHLNF